MESLRSVIFYNRSFDTKVEEIDPETLCETAPFITKMQFLFRFDWTLAASGDACMKLHEVKKRTAEPQNIEYRMSKGGFASLSHF